MILNMKIIIKMQLVHLKCMNYDLKHYNNISLKCKYNPFEIHNYDLKHENNY